MAAVGTHIATIKRGPETGSPAYIERVVADVPNAPNSVNSPLLDDYIRLEATAGYAISVLNDRKIVTIDTTAV